MEALKCVMYFLLFFKYVIILYFKCMLDACISNMYSVILLYN